MKEIFPGVYSWRKRLWTKNLVPKQRVYGETIAEFNGIEYREWNPFRSKLSAAIHKKLKNMPIVPEARILYLGIAEGTTASHISDIIGANGLILGIDISETCIAKLLLLCEKRKNILPVIADANRPESYADYAFEVKPSIIYQDVSQKNQVEILSKNADMFLQKGNFALLALKAPSISSTKNPSKIFEKQEELLQKNFEIVERVSLAPFEKKHMFYVLRKK